MVNGSFTGDIPVVKVVVAWGQSVQTPTVILDTGFTGDLLVTPQIATDLGLEVTGITNARSANGVITAMPTALALADMEGVKNFIQVFIAESFPLLGISFLTKFGYKATIDCKYRTVLLNKDH